MSRDYGAALAVFQGYVPHLMEAAVGEPYLTLCEFRIGGDGWTGVRVLYERRRE